MESLLTFPIRESRLLVFVSFSGTRATSGVAVQVLDHFPDNFFAFCDKPIFKETTSSFFQFGLIIVLSLNAVHSKYININDFCKSPKSEHSL